MKARAVVLSGLLWWAGGAHAEYTLYPETQKLTSEISSSMATADLNGDGKVDVVVAGRLPDGSFFITAYENQGNFQFLDHTVYTLALGATYAGSTAAPLSVCDVNGDGKPDIVTGITQWESPPLIPPVLLNQGGFTFAPYKEITSNITNRVRGGRYSISPKLTRCVDMNGDGVKEFGILGAFNEVGLVGSQIQAMSSIAVLDYLGGTNFNAAAFNIAGELAGVPEQMTYGLESITLKAGESARLLARELIGGSPRTELITRNGAAITVKSVSGVNENFLATADFNGDGNGDVLGQSGAVYLGDGLGGFTVSTTMSGAPLATDARTTGIDFNGDGFTDLIELRNKRVVLRRNVAGASFAAKNAELYGDVSAFGVGDFNGDGTPDVFATTTIPEMFYLQTHRVFRGLQRYVIRGRITEGGLPVLGVEVKLDGPSTGTTFTDAQGFYEISDAPTGSYTVTPVKAGHSFNPPSISLSALNTDQREVNFDSHSDYMPPPRTTELPKVRAERSRMGSSSGSTRLSFVVENLPSQDFTVVVTTYRNNSKIESVRSKRIKTTAINGSVVRPTSKVKKANRFCTVPYSAGNQAGIRTCAAITKR